MPRRTRPGVTVTLHKPEVIEFLGTIKKSDRARFVERAVDHFRGTKLGKSVIEFAMRRRPPEGADTGAAPPKSAQPAAREAKRGSAAPQAPDVMGDFAQED